MTRGDSDDFLLLLSDIPFAQQYAAYINSLGVDLWLKLNEVSGNPVNNGSLSGLTITNSTGAAPTQGQNGVPTHGEARLNEAYDFAGDAANGAMVSIANNATIKAWTTQKWCFVCHPDTLGAGNAGQIAVWGGFGVTDHKLLGLVSSNRIQATINTDSTNAQATANVNQISDCVGVDCLFFVDYDDSNILANGRKIRIFKSVAGVVTQITLATDTAAVGNVDQPTTALIIGNRNVRDQTFDGRIDEIIAKGAAVGADTAAKTACLWTTTEMQNITNYFRAEPYLSGVIYVDKLGSDSNVGSVASPVLTIARANALANATITKIVVNAGTYNELVTPPFAGLTYQAVGPVIVDGAINTRNGFTVAVPNITINGFTFTNCITGVQFNSGGNNGVVNDCESSLSTARGFYAFGATGVIFRRCYSHDHTSGYGFEFEGNADNGAAIRCWSTSGQHGFICKTSTSIRFDGCVVFNTTLSGFYSKAGNGMKVYNCVSYNTNYGVYLADNAGVDPNSSNADIKNTIIQGAVRAIYAVESGDISGLLSDYNDFYGNTLVGVIVAVTYAALVNWQGQGYDTHSQTVNPSFASVVYGGFRLAVGNSLLTAGSSGVAIGRDGSTWDG